VPSIISYPLLSTPASQQRGAGQQGGGATVCELMGGGGGRCRCRVVGVKNVERDPGLLEYPHARCNCLKVQFVRLEPEDKDYPSGSVADRQTNSRHCDKCFCWVCDRIATQCSQWEQHCMAVDSHQHWQREQKLRKAAQAAKT
jgi:hypothetical protein